MLRLARSIEVSESQAQKIEEAKVRSEYRTSDCEVNKLRRRTDTLTKDKAVPNGRKCFNCGNSWPHLDRSCPAKGKQCRTCNKDNHFAVMCRSKKNVHSLKEDADEVSDGSSDDGYVYSNKRTRQEDETIADVDIKGRHIKVRVDTCSDVNVIDELTFENFKALVQLKNTKLNLFAYGGHSHSTYAQNLKIPPPLPQYAFCIGKMVLFIKSVRSGETPPLPLGAYVLCE